MSGRENPFRRVTDLVPDGERDATFDLVAIACEHRPQMNVSGRVALVYEGDVRLRSFVYVGSRN